MHFYAPVYLVFISIRQYRLQLGLVYVHLALDSQFSDIRKLAGSSVTEAMKRAPRQTGRIIREALSNFVARDPHAQKAAPTVSTEESATARSKHGRLSALLLSSVTFPEDVNDTLREDAVVELIVLAHHGLICSYAVLSWPYGFAHC